MSTPRVTLHIVSYLFLHQTTTLEQVLKSAADCLLPFFYIKPQPPRPKRKPQSHCLLPFFYIKPQLCRRVCCWGRYCLLPFFYIKPQRQPVYHLQRYNCLLPFFYIKPQLYSVNHSELIIVSYLFSTSNHNLCYSRQAHDELSLTFFLHQTTTVLILMIYSLLLSLTFFLHQTTTERQE